jgi:hypothetical protein
VLSEPLAVGLHALNRAGGVAGARVLVSGCGPDRVLVQLGMFPPGPRPVELSTLIAREIDYPGSFRFDSEFDDAIALLGRTTALDAVITHRFELADAATATAVAADPRFRARSYCGWRYRQARSADRSRPPDLQPIGAPTDPNAIMASGRTTAIVRTSSRPVVRVWPNPLRLERCAFPSSIPPGRSAIRRCPPTPPPNTVLPKTPRPALTTS